MASVSISHLVLFIASIIVAASVAGTLVTGVDRVSDAMNDQSIDTSEGIAADLSIISDTGSDAIYDDDEVVLLLKNTGSTTLVPDTDQLDVLVNGVYQPSDRLTVTDVAGESTDDWGPGDVIRLTIDTTLDSGDHRVSVAAGGGDDTVQFRIDD